MRHMRNMRNMRNMQLIVTRPREQGLAAVQELCALGVDAVTLPLIGIEPMTSDVADPNAEVGRWWATLSERRLVMFVSANAVMRFFADAPAVVAWPTHTLAGSTGPGTTAALCAAGVPMGNVREPGPDAPRLDSEALWQQLRALDWRGASVLIVRGEGGRDWFAQTLRQAGAQVDHVAAYRRTMPAWTAEESALLTAAQAQPERFAWHLSSSEAAGNLLRLAPGGAWRGSLALTTHERIGQAAREAGFAQVQVLAPGVQALVLAWSTAVDRARLRAGAPIQSGPL